MKVSVSVVTYNHERFISKCLDSVLSQRVNFDYEIVVGEDFSTDSTRSILLNYKDKHPNRIKTILQDRNVGVLRNFQMVLDGCQGDYIAHLDGDDLMLPGKMQKQVDFLDSHPDFVMVTHDVRVFDSDTDKTLGYFNETFKLADGDLRDLIRYGTYFANSSKMYRRSSLPEEGIDVNTKYVIDWLLHMQSARQGRIGYLDEVLGEYRKHSGGTTHFDLDKSAEVLKDREYILGKAAGMVNDKALTDHAYASIYYNFAWECFLRRHFREFRKYIEKSVGNRVFIDRSHALLYRFRHFPVLLHSLRRMKRILQPGNA